MNKSIDDCPLCGKPLIITKYYEEIWGHKEIVETDKRCTCGYHHSLAYGNEVIEYPDGI